MNQTTDALTVKIYSKGESLLRIEAIVHNAEALGCRRALDNLPQIISRLSGKNLIRKIEKSRTYQTAPDGLRALTALLVLREKIIKPILAGAAKPKPGPKPKNKIPVDKHYRNMQSEMRQLFLTMGIAA